MVDQHRLAEKSSKIAGEIGSENYGERSKALRDVATDQAKMPNAAFQSELSRVARQVDMKQLGLSGFQLSGVHGTLDGKQAFEFKGKDGSIALLGADGKIERHGPAGAEKPGVDGVVRGANAPFGKHGRELTNPKDGTGEYHVKKGDNLWNIAKDLLHSQAKEGKVTDREILNKLKEIEADNNRNHKTSLLPGDHLKLRLPGAAAPEGKQPVIAAPEGKQPVIAAPEGKQPVIAAPEGKQPVIAAPEGKQPLVAAPDATKVAQAALDAKVGELKGAMDAQGLSAADKSQFTQDLTKFLGSKLPLDEQTKTLDSITKLAASNNANNLLAARELLFHAASPDTVNQGQSNFCGPTSVEHDLLRTNPSKVAGMVADALLTGGKQFLDPSKLMKGDELKPYKGPANHNNYSIDENQFDPTIADTNDANALTFASHIFSTAMLKDMAQHTFGTPMDFKGDGYNTFAWQDGDKLYSNIRDTPGFDDGIKKGVVDPGEGPTGWEISREYERLTGRSNEMFQSASYKYEVGGGPRGNYLPPPDHKACSSDGMTYIDTTSASGLPDLVEKLRDRLKTGSALVQLKYKYVDDGHLVKAGDAGSVQDPSLIPKVVKGVPDHFISIDAINDTGTAVLIHNQHGKDEDGWIPVEALYKAMS